jgi:hypothetical protein
MSPADRIILAYTGHPGLKQIGRQEKNLRISKAALLRIWIWSTGLGLAVFLVLAVLDIKLRVLSGVGTADLQSLTSAVQYRAAFWAWNPQSYALRAGFNLGFDYLLMPLYAASFYCSAIILAGALPPRGRLHRLVVAAAVVPLVGAFCDTAENALQLWMLLNGPSDGLARIAAGASNIKDAALIVGVLLLVGAVMALVAQRKKPPEPIPPLL